jgi:hypothetical protein
LCAVSAARHREATVGPTLKLAVARHSKFLSSATTHLNVVALSDFRISTRSYEARRLARRGQREPQTETVCRRSVQWLTDVSKALLQRHGQTHWNQLEGCSRPVEPLLGAVQ